MSLFVFAFFFWFYLRVSAIYLVNGTCFLFLEWNRSVFYFRLEFDQPFKKRFFRLQNVDVLNCFLFLSNLFFKKKWKNIVDLDKPLLLCFVFYKFFNLTPFICSRVAPNLPSSHNLFHAFSCKIYSKNRKFKQKYVFIRLNPDKKYR